MKRNKHSLSHYQLYTGDMGQLIPTNVMEVLPGDTIQQSTSLLLRVSPLVAPVMHPVVVRMHHYFVPYRLLWDGWESFITGGNDGDGDGVGSIPTINSGAGWNKGSLADYFGLPPNVANLDVSALPFRAYNLIFNELYRDQDLVTEVPEDAISVRNCAWEKDYFTASRPWPQRGTQVTLPLGTTAPVQSTDGLIKMYNSADSTERNLQQDASGALFTNTTTAGSMRFGTDTGLEADLSGATSVSIDTVRTAFSLQRYAEARARYGARYTEYLRYLDINPADSRLQRPEYLGGGKSTISFSEVLQTSNDGVNGSVGDMAGHGISAMRTRKFRKFIPEHGVVMSLMSVRPKAMYSDGVPRMWTRQTKEDFWQKELQHIGQQEVYQREIYAQGTAADDDVFGYNDRYAEYRSQQSCISGDFRDTLNFWHMGRLLGSNPALNEDFIKCDPSKRNYAVQTNDVLWCMANHSIQARRMVTNNATPSVR